MIIDTADDTSKQLGNLKKAGVVAIIRYYSASAWKRVGPVEAKAIADAGLEMGAVYEDAGATPGAFSAASGVAHATNAVRQAQLVGQPAGSAIYFAVDFDPSDSQIQDLILPYFASVYQVVGGKYRVGAYASGRCCSLLMENHPDLLPWITCSLGFNGSRTFLSAGKQVLYQGTFNGSGVPRSGCDKVLYGLSVDYNTAHQDDWGQFKPFGDTGLPVIVHDIPWMQQKLGVTSDGIVGPMTIAAMIRYIESHNA